MIARFALVLAVAMAWLWPGAANAQSDRIGYSYCTVAKGPLRVLRTVTTDEKRFVYQAAWGGIVPGKPRRIEGYLGWHAGPNGAVELQIAQESGFFSDEQDLPDGSRAVFEGPAGTARISSQSERKQNNLLYRFDAAAVLAAFPGLHDVRLRIYAKGRDIPRTSVTLSLDALRQVLDDARAADGELSGSSCDDMTTTRPEVTDPARFTQCRAATADGSVDFSPWNLRYVVNIPLSHRLALVVAADSWRGNARPLVGDALAANVAAALRDPFGDKQPPMLTLIATEGAMPEDGGHYVLSAGSQRVVLLVRSLKVDWPALFALEKAGPVKLELFRASGKLLDTVEVPAGALAGLHGALARLADGVKAAVGTPMLACEPEPDIVIT